LIETTFLILWCLVSILAAGRKKVFDFGDVSSFGLIVGFFEH
jgi:hypothetical protein